MSYKGLKKAIDRAPHNLLGKKSVDDRIILQYDSDIKTSIAGLQFIVLESSKLKNDWNAFFKNQSKIIDLFKVMIEPIEFKDIDKYNEFLAKLQDETDLVQLEELDETADSTKNQIQEYKKVMNELKINVEIEIGTLEGSTKLRCQEMVKYLESTLKILKKRDHKKVDYDRFTNKISKLMKKTPPLSSKDEQDLETYQNSLDQAKELFDKLDEKVKVVLPHTLSLLEEFLHKIMNMIYYKQLDLFKMMNQVLMDFARDNGLRDVQPLEYDEIIDAWEKDFMLAKIKIETLDLLKDSKIVELPLEVIKESKVDKVRNNLQKGGSKSLEKTTNLITKTLHHNAAHLNYKLNIENPVKPYDRQGIFDQAADPLRSYIVYHNDNYNPPQDEMFKKKYNEKRQSHSHQRSSSYWSRFIGSPLLTGSPLFQEQSPSPSPISNNNSFASTQAVRSSRTSSVSTKLSVPLIAGPNSESSTISGGNFSSQIDSRLSNVYNKYKWSINEAPFIAETKDISTDVKLKAEGEVSLTSQLIKFINLFDDLSHDDQTFSKRAVAKHSYSGKRPGDLSFEKGEEITLLGLNNEREGYDWWIGKTTDKRIGFLPSNYVTVI